MFALLQSRIPNAKAAPQAGWSLSVDEKHGCGVPCVIGDAVVSNVGTSVGAAVDGDVDGELVGARVGDSVGVSVGN
jgi:hypothetical protein